MEKTMLMIVCGLVMMECVSSLRGASIPDGESDCCTRACDFCCGICCGLAFAPTCAFGYVVRRCADRLIPLYVSGAPDVQHMSVVVRADSPKPEVRLRGYSRSRESSPRACSSSGLNKRNIV